jgi:thymidylate kinase
MTEQRNVVLLEGGEGTAKTSIADMLVEKGYHRVKLPSPKSSFETLIFNAKKLPITITQKAYAAVLDFHYSLQEALATTHKPIVLDRGPLSTWAYQTALDLAQATKNLRVEESFNAITHIYIGDVSPEVGLKREANPNEVSKAGLEFHRQVNAKYRLLGHMLSHLALFRQACASIGYTQDETDRMLSLSQVGEITARQPIRDLDFIAMTQSLRESITPNGASAAGYMKLYTDGQWRHLLDLNFSGLRKVWFIDTEKQGFKSVLQTIASDLRLSDYVQCS